jgi:hypothetical protein
MSYSFFPNDFQNLPNLQDQLFLMKQKQAAQRLQEVFVLNPSQIASETIGTPHPFRNREHVIGRGTQRAEVLGRFMAAHTYHAVSDDERDAIERIMIDTGHSSPERKRQTPGADIMQYQGMNTFRPGPRTAGTEATGEHLKIALGAMKRLESDPKFAEHHTNMMAGKLSDTVVRRSAEEDMMSDEPYYGRTIAGEKALERRSQRNAQGLTPSTKVSDISKEFGTRMNVKPYNSPDESPREYSDFLPIDMVKTMGDEFITNQRNKKSADAYQAERAKHLGAGTYES